MSYKSFGLMFETLNSDRKHLQKERDHIEKAAKGEHPYDGSVPVEKMSVEQRMWKRRGEELKKSRDAAKIS